MFDNSSLLDAMPSPQTDRNKRTLSERCLELAALGYDVDCAAVGKWGVDLATLKRLAEAYRMGWLHNVMSRITPLTVRRQEDYVAMADIFILSNEEANQLITKFQTDMELFCQMAGIRITEHMTKETVSKELKSHVALYDAISELLTVKYGIIAADPIQEMALAPLEDGLDSHDGNPFIREFMDQQFPERLSS